MYKQTKIVSENYIKNKTIIAVVVFVIIIITALFVWKKLQQQPKEVGILKPLRRGLELNEYLFSTFLYNNKHKSREYATKLAAPKVRVNGDVGVSSNIDTANWKLQLVKSKGDTISISLDELKAMPKTEVTFDFKCIEGWNQITHWAGVRFSDLIKKYGLTNQTSFQYVGMQTPDSAYYVGIDMPSMMHQQTILCYEMNGKPLPMNQGFPLRLIIPVKYGVKHLKRIGTIFFANEKPRDYWYELGYDYYCGM